MTTYVGNPPKSVYGVKEATNVIASITTDGVATSYTIDLPDDLETLGVLEVRIRSNVATGTPETQLMMGQNPTGTNYYTQYNNFTKTGLISSGQSTYAIFSASNAGGNSLFCAGQLAYRDSLYSWQSESTYYVAGIASQQRTSLAGFEVNGYWGPVTQLVWQQPGGAALPAGIVLDIYTAEATSLITPLEYSAPQKNVVHNSDFSINQLGTTLGSAGTAGARYIDRWLCSSAAANSTLTVSGIVATVDNTTASTDGRFFQGIEEGDLVPGETYVVSWEGGAEVSVYRANGNAWDWKTDTFTFVAQSGATGGGSAEYIAFQGDGAKISKLKVERGTIPTPWEVPDRATELEKCKRYFQLQDYRSYQYYTCFRDGTTAVMCLRELPVEMRVTPIFDSLVSGTGTGHKVRRVHDDVDVSITVAQQNALHWNGTPRHAGIYLAGGLSGLVSSPYVFYPQATFTIGLTAEPT